jgi:hypothetical protein
MTSVSMKPLRALLIASLSLIAFAQQPLVMAPLKIKAMLAAVSRDGDFVTGGIGPGRQLKLGHVYVEPVRRQNLITLEIQAVRGALLPIPVI